MEAIITNLLEGGGPAMVVAAGFLWYLHKQTEKKDGEIDKIRLENKGLVDQLIDVQEKRLTADAENRELLRVLIDKSGRSSEVLEMAFTRMEANQLKILEEIQELKRKH